jgi:hypothetical protein
MGIAKHKFNNLGPAMQELAFKSPKRDRKVSKYITVNLRLKRI